MTDPPSDSIAELTERAVARLMAAVDDGRLDIDEAGRTLARLHAARTVDELRRTAGAIPGSAGFPDRFPRPPGGPGGHSTWAELLRIALIGIGALAVGVLVVLAMMHGVPLPHRP